MSRKFFFKNQVSLQRQIVTGSLAAVFVAGTVGGGFARAMEWKDENLQFYMLIKEESKEDKKGKKKTGK